MNAAFLASEPPHELRRADQERPGCSLPKYASGVTSGRVAAASESALPVRGDNQRRHTWKGNSMQLRLEGSWLVVAMAVIVSGQHCTGG